MRVDARLRRAWPPLVAVASLVLAATVAVTGGGRFGAVAAVADAPGGTVSVSGVGTVRGVPDTLTATLDAHVMCASAQAALNGVAAATGRVLAAFRRAGVARRDVQTSGLTLSPHYGERGGVVGYDADETITARISPLGRVGRTLASAVSSAGNEVSVNGLSFDLVNDEALLRQARTAAFADARDRAQQYAEASGRSLGHVVKISESVQVEQPPFPYADRFAAASGDVAKAVVPIRAGTQPVTVTVTVLWALR